MNYSERIEGINESKTIAISAKADKLAAAGEDIISFGVGEPDFPTPEYIKKAAAEAMTKGYTGYTAASGLTKLKKAAIKNFAKEYSYDYKLDEVIICNGGKQVLFNGLMSILNPGEEVIIPKPYWVSYPEIVRLAGAKPVTIETKSKNKYKMTAQELKDNITSNTKALIINSPSNPDGHFYNQNEINEILNIIKEKEIFIISDEIYAKLLYDNKKFVSLIKQVPQLKNKILIVNGMSKSYAMTGWRVGFGFANSDWINKMAKIQSHTTSNVNTIAQYASAKALENNELSKIINERKNVYQKRRDLVFELLSKINGLETIKPTGAFYYFVDISKLIGKTSAGEEIRGSLSFTDLLLEKAKVAVVPGISFGMDNYIRISFALDSEEIKQGISRIDQFVKDLK